MANALYGKARQAFADGDLDWSANDIKACLIDATDYTVDIDVDEFLDDIAGAAIVATSSNFASKTNTLGVVDAADIVFSAVSGDACDAIVIYQDSGSAATSRLIAYIDSATGLPVTPTGGNITVQWDSGANKIFKL